MDDKYKELLQQARKAIEWAERTLPRFIELRDEVKVEIQANRSLYPGGPHQILVSAYNTVLARQLQQDEIEDVIFD